MAILSVLGLLKVDNHLFDNLHLPDGVDKTTLTSNIIAECAELEVAYPNPVVFRYILENWSYARVDAWSRVYKALSAEYSPIENTDKYEETTLGPVENSGKDSAQPMTGLKFNLSVSKIRLNQSLILYTRMEILE